jgi:hypothetical protein
VTVRSGWLLNASEATPGQSRQDTRLSPIGTYTPVDALSSRSGVIPGGTGLNLTGTGMTGTISTGRAVVQGTSSQGAYPVVVSAAESFTVANGDGSNPRIDSVFLIVYDKLFDSSGNALAAVVYVQGTPAGSPTAPNAPSTTNASLRLWDILVPVGASAGSPINWATALTDRRTYTVAVGGINPDGATAGAYARQYRDGGATTGLERWSGSAWESRLYLGTSGQVIIGTDTNLYRGGANNLKTDDSFTAVGGITNLASAVAEDTTSRTTTSTSLTTVAGLTAPTLTVPPSGRVKVTITVLQRNSTTGNVFTSFRAVGSSSGTNYTETLTGAISSTGSNNVTGTKIYRLTGLTAGETLTVTPYHMTNTGTGTWDYRYVLLEGMGA